jgi:TP901 family phage tail tape measure protein
VASRSENLELIIKAKNLTNDELKKMARELDKTGASVKDVNRTLAALDRIGISRTYKDIQREINQLNAAYKRLKKDGVVSANDLYRAKLKLQQKTADLKRETGNWTEQMGKAKAGMAALAGAGYLFIKSFQEYSQFSQRMGEVNTLIDVSQERFAKLGKEIRGLTKDIPQSASELAAAEYDILSAGVALDKSVGVLEKSAKAAVAGVTDTKTAANAGIAVINAYGKSIDELDNVYDTLFQTVKLGVTTFPQLAQSIGEVLPTARAADVGIKEVGASIAALTKAGIRTPQAMTSLKGAINALVAPAPEAKKQFEALGITWKGLIPTLEEIRKKSLSIEQMRLLIPDVEARTGVLALTQNFDTLVEILGEMENAGGATEAAYKKMADTPENQIKLFKNTIDDITLSLGSVVAKGLLPAAKAIRWLIEGLKDADPVTKTFVLALASATAGFTLWKLGLGSVILGLKGFIIQAKAATVASGALGTAMKIGLAGAAIYGVVNIGLAIKALYEWKKAADVAKKAQDNLIETSDQYLRKFGEFKDIKLPDDISKLAREDLEKLRKDLAKARAYYIALKAKMEETGDTAGLKDVNDRIKEIQADFVRVGESASDASEEMKKPVEAIKATDKQLEEFEKQAKKAYEEAKKQAKDYADKVIEFEEKIKYARLSTEDKIRELGRKGLDQAEAWADKRRQAEEKLYAAKQALAEKDYKLAEQLARDAEGLYADLATEVKGSKDGNDIVVKSLEDTKQVAINGVTEVGQFVEDLYTTQKDAAQTARDEWQATADGINKQLDEIAKQREANINIKLNGLIEAQNHINDLIKPEYKDIYIRIHQQEAKRFGGIAGLVQTTAGVVKAATGKLLPGYGGGDTVDAKLEKGEGVLTKEAIAWKGPALFYSYLKKDKIGMLKALLGEVSSRISIPDIPQPRTHFQTGGIAAASGGSGETMTLRFQAGNVEMPLTVQGNTGTIRQQVKNLEKELIKLGMVTR